MRSFQPNKFTYTSPVRLFVTNNFSTPYPLKVVFVTLRWLEVFELHGRWCCYASVLATFVLRTIEALYAKQWKRPWKDRAKMFVILNSKMQPEVWYVRAQILANPSFRVAVLYPVNVSRIPHRILVKFRMKGIPFKTGMKTTREATGLTGWSPFVMVFIFCTVIPSDWIYSTGCCCYCCY